jgi:hypothetical protein
MSDENKKESLFSETGSMGAFPGTPIVQPMVEAIEGDESEEGLVESDDDEEDD